MSMFLNENAFIGGTDSLPSEPSPTTYALAESLQYKEAVLLDEDAATLARAAQDGLVTLSEAAPLKTSRKVVVKTKQQKVNRLKQQLAMDIAKQNNDPLYAKYSKFRLLELLYRKKIETKYTSRAKSAAMKVASGGENPLKKPAIMTKKAK